MTAETTENPAAESLRLEQEAQKAKEAKKGKDGDLSEALEDTFPASDPIAMQSTTTPGAKKDD